MYSIAVRYLRYNRTGKIILYSSIALTCGVRKFPSLILQLLLAELFLYAGLAYHGRTPCGVQLAFIRVADPDPVGSTFRCRIRISVKNHRTNVCLTILKENYL